MIPQFMIDTFNDITMMLQKLLTKEVQYATRSIILTDDREILILMLNNKDREKFLIECGECWDIQQNVIADFKMNQAATQPTTPKIQ